MNKQIKIKIENKKISDKKNLNNILPTQNEITLDNEIWITSIEKLRNKNYKKLSEAINGLVDEVISKLNLNTSDEDLKLFLYDMCTDNEDILKVIEEQLL